MKYQIQKLEALKKGQLPEQLLLLVNEKQAKEGKFTFLSESLQKQIHRALVRRKDSPLKAEAILQVQGHESHDPDVMIAVLPEKAVSYTALGVAKTILKSLITHETESVGMVYVDHTEASVWEEALGAALAARLFHVPTYGKRKKDHKDYRLKEVIAYGKSLNAKNWDYGWVSGEGTNLVRYLGLLPSNELGPAQYGKLIRKYAEDHDLQVRFYSKSELKKLGAGAFVAVDRGNPKSDGGIYEISYEPKKSKSKDWIALVGKGMCFDTGGYDVKTQGAMVTMKGDMQGSAVALATLLAAVKLEWPLKMKAYLAVTENHLSPEAYHADEVVTALNGMTIEVVDSDAEGRMVLSDTLTLASRTKPKLVVDLATLTGSAVRAIGNTYGVAFSNREELHAKILQAGKKSGERVWPFPVDSDHGKALESDVADILQCSKGKGPDHIYAAYFLSQFVEKGIDWVHVDLSPSEREGGLAHTDTIFTGFGVRFSLEFIKKYSGL